MTHNTLYTLLQVSALLPLSSLPPLYHFLCTFSVPQIAAQCQESTVMLCIVAVKCDVSWRQFIVTFAD